jgi:BirA family biotin operon repressor/biotin-[acetyl-CoA-carboxylase] ligase
VYRIPEKELRLAHILSVRGFPDISVYCFSEVSSTMDTAFTMPESMIVNRAVIVADKQTLGRGRFDRTWYDAEGSIALSVILTDYDSRIPYSMVASYAVYKTFLAVSGRVRLKWINDVLWENGKKVSGILTEERSGRTVIGIGVNINTEYFPPELSNTATSYRLESGRVLDVEVFIGDLLSNLFVLFNNIQTHGIESVLTQWEDGAGMTGRNAVIVLDDGTRLSGYIKGLDKESGALLLDVDGAVREVYGGCISFE